MLNLIGFGFGLLAWGLGAAAIRKGCLWFVFGSMASCGFALTAQLLEIGRRTQRCDWTALLDTVHVVTFAAVTLLAVTLLLNAAALLRFRRG